ncbi:hypothetical protein FIBSPDRAFT_820851 [Athelia psychrophila]|uniref:CSC1/OSCA1-like 7TM region domain-containing protein n=1 Tax=Athelia psychrophila TaxID=1759441 RepID=A0A166NTS7_9AGAM|nr:hypothetical protein FIBSPDRAFT_820851 [Fibularhizoctonia sp. CBS 109695]
MDTSSIAGPSSASTPFPEPSSSYIPTPSSSYISASSVIPQSTSASDATASSSTQYPASSTGQITTASFMTTTFTSSVLSTFIQPSTTITSDVQTVITTTVPIFISPATQTAQAALRVQPVCIGQGVDVLSEGVIAAVIIPSAIGIVLWIVFAIVRPRYRQLYALREWFVQPEHRPKPLGSSFWAFLFPHVPLVPSVPKDVSDAGRSPAGDAVLFPSDEQLSQRALWISFLIVLGWTFLGLAGALPLYLVSTPCLAHSASPGTFTGAYSIMQDLSVMRLLQLLESGNTTLTTYGGLRARASTDTADDQPTHIYIRLIILTAMTLGAAILPALWKILHEFTRLVNYRKRWIAVKCEGKEMAWLSARDAPGFIGWGEKQLKSFILKTGLSNAFDVGTGRNGTRRRAQRERERRDEDDVDQPLTSAEEANLEIDVQSLFSVSETHKLALLIDDRDEILENLEIAETRYIASFRLSTPDPSIADFEPPILEENKDRPYISRPRALGGAVPRGEPGPGRRRRRRANPAYAASSLAPTSFVAPSQYYKLRRVQGLSNGQFADTASQQSLSDSINQRVVGSRFQEVNRNSQLYGRLAIGSHLMVENDGELGPHAPHAPPPLEDARPRYGPNFDQQSWIHETGPVGQDDEWVDLMRETPIDFGEFSPSPPSASATPARAPTEESLFARRRPKIFQGKGNTEDSAARRETFPLRTREEDYEGDTGLVPPHLRVQQQQPFVRPLSGVDHNDLGSVYGNISHWRSRLKAINAEIEEAQRQGYSNIAEGSHIKGWLLIGRGLRFIPGTQLIEGRAKEDVRWDVLQNERSKLDTFVLGAIIVVVVALLAGALTAVAGLALANAPDFAHYLSFLQPIAEAGGIPSGLATTLAPAAAAAVFICLAVTIVSWATNMRGTVSVSAGQLIVFKVVFWILTLAAGVFLVLVGALLFAAPDFDTGVSAWQAVADGSIYISTLVMLICTSMAVIFPALLMLQPLRLLSLRRAESEALTPRQNFRAAYPRSYDPTLATGACVLAIIFASTFSLIFPLIGPSVVVLLFLTLVAHRYLVGYVYARTHSQTGGVLQIWFFRRFATLLSLQPLLLGLIFLSRQLWILGGVLIGMAVCIVIGVEAYCALKTRLPGPKSLSAITQDCLRTFSETSKLKSDTGESEGTSLVSTGHRTHRHRGSMASVLDMMSLTLAVEPSSSKQRGPVPLQTETLDDLTATERAARTHPDAPPHLPPLGFTDHAEDMAGILYAPELVAPPPIIWLPNDSAGVARSEAYDIERYHSLRATLDVRATDDVIPRTSSSSKNKHAS